MSCESKSNGDQKKLPCDNGCSDVVNNNGVTSKHQDNVTADMDLFEASLIHDARAALALASLVRGDMARKFMSIIERCEGTLLTSGIGKSGILASRMAASLSSIGKPSHFVHGAEWVHGDLGKARHGDVCIFLSHSGNTCECIFAATHLRDRGVHVLTITSNPTSQLALCSDAFVSYDVKFDLEEPIGGVPTTSIILQEMLTNAIVKHTIHTGGFGPVEFAKNHPGGSLGQKLYSMSY